MSRELDAEVAEKVMGNAEYKRVLLNFDKDGKKIYSKPVYMGPEYSTDISAAWEVVEKLGVDSFHLSQHTTTPWECSFSTGVDQLHERFVYSRAEGKTAPEAICNAALKTLKEPD